MMEAAPAAGAGAANFVAFPDVVAAVVGEQVVVIAVPVVAVPVVVAIAIVAVFALGLAAALL